MDPPKSTSITRLDSDPGGGPTMTAMQTTFSQQHLQHQPTPTPAHSKAAKPSDLKVTPYSNYQSQSQSPNTPNRTTPPVRRKPLPPSASPSTLKAPGLSTGGKVIAVGLDSTPEEQVTNTNPTTVRPPWEQNASGNNSPRLVVRNLDQFPRGLSPNVPQSPGFTPFHKLTPEQARDILNDLDTEAYSPSTISHARNSDPPVASPIAAKAPRPLGHLGQRSVTMPLRSGGPTQIQMPPANTVNNGPLTPQRQNSASTKISSFFGWKGSNHNNSNNYATSPIAETSPTTISDRSSINGSPNGAHTHATSVSSHYTTKPMPAAIDVPRANAPAVALFTGAGFPQAPPTPAMSVQVGEMEEELKELSEELANSIRREMELEEQLERWQADGSNVQDKRSSDYFSDSGISSSRDQDGSDPRTDEVRRLKRQSAQEKAQLKVNVSQRVQEERNKRKALEEHIKNMESHIQNLELQGGGSDRVVELQNALEDSRRRLVEERKHKENYEDLIAALRVDLIQRQNERDNLRDEIVPSLKARLEGLESDAAEAQRLTYENARMQQELQAVRAGKFEPISEEGTAPKTGLSRSASLMRGSNSGTMSRSNSISNKNEPRESREQLAERVKTIEAQRDALHQALKSLLDRQKFQSREFEKRLSTVEQERDRALEASSPRRRGYEKEVTDLRYEINQLRKRADDALEQKWQCEKGLGGLKMDLDRAEQETSSLRKLLSENDIMVPDLSTLTSSNAASSAHATSLTLERAYKQLREAQAISVEKLRELKDIGPSKADDAKTNDTLDMLLKTMTNAEAERDFAQKQVESYRAQAESLQDAKEFQEGENAGLLNELKASASRVDVLSAQVKRQLSANSDLRERLAEAVGKGEREQKSSASRINGLQSKLKGLEDKLMAAQQQSEDSMLVHEEDMRVIRKSTSSQLQRLKPPAMSKDGGNSLKPPRSPLEPRSPRLDRTTSGLGMSMAENLRTEYLEQRVKELEGALSDAEQEMGEVVQRMNAAQIEVMDLQSARDEAMKQTRALQDQIMAENKNVGTLTRLFSR